ncbi:TPA: dihydroxyacetone kinase [Streptococcus pyogenes]|nr:dihydroxyacetone kinase [Streptococcus pyogenes]HES3850025.1 dihydroxyacetone kinase [Streptococcus pyogenes]
MQLLDNVYGTLRSFAFMRPVKSSNDTSLTDALQADTDMAFILVRGINYQ